MAFTPVQKLSITSGAAMLLLAAVGVVAYLSTTQLVDAQRAAAATNLNIARLDHVLQRTIAADEAISRYTESGDRAFLSVIDTAQSDLEYVLDSLRTATEDHPVQRRHLDTLGAVVGARLREIRQVALVREKVGQDSAAKLFGAGRSVARPTRLLADMRNEEVRVLGERTRVMADSAESTRVFIVAGSIFALLLALVALQPLRPSVERKLTERLSTTIAAIRDDESTSR